MNQSKAKKTRIAMKHIALNWADQVKQACEDKLRMPNRHGYLQHRIINPKRQIKKMVMREGLA